MSRLNLILRLSPDVLVKRALGLVRRKVSSGFARRRDRRRQSYGGPVGDVVGILRRPLSRDWVLPHAHWIRPLAGRYRHGQFDLLGSGWTDVYHGVTAKGVHGWVYPSGPLVTPDPKGRWLQNRINPANLSYARSVWALVRPHYRPIDWQLDFKSGYRWSECLWSQDCRFGHLPGVDVKVPWELARMQHLVVLGWSYLLDGNPEDPACFRDHVLDFIATNPPHFGINWRCAMDVGIRVANWVTAHDMFRNVGYTFDSDFEEIFSASIGDHIRFLLCNLEYYPEGRGNHYLADICSLLFSLVALSQNAQNDAWLSFSIQEFLAETEYQFNPDGGNFEASTCYHRLSSEMVVFAAAALVGIPEQRLQSLVAANPVLVVTKPRRRLRAGPHRPGDGFWAQVEAMAQFTRWISKPDGRIVQIGDNDSGRFLRCHPMVSPTCLSEEHLDHRPLVAAICRLIDRPDLEEWAGGSWLDGVMIEALAGSPQRRKSRVASPLTQIGAPLLQNRAQAPCVTRILLPGGDLREGLEQAAFPDFGVYVMRSKRIWMALRCGSIGLMGRGGHAHNDQLSIELVVDGEDWLADPGSYLYTADRQARNLYRSVKAHAAPRYGDVEPGSLSLGDFWLGNEAQGRCVWFFDGDFCGTHQGYGFPVLRRVRLLSDQIVIDDNIPGVQGERVLREREQVRSVLGSAVPFSGSYGVRVCDC